MQSGGITPIWHKLKWEKQILKGASVSLFLHRLMCFNHQCWWQKRGKSPCHNQRVLQIETNLSEPDAWDKTATSPAGHFPLAPTACLHLSCSLGSVALSGFCVFLSQLFFYFFTNSLKKGCGGSVVSRRGALLLLSVPTGDGYWGGYPLSTQSDV